MAQTLALLEAALEDMAVPEIEIICVDETHYNCDPTKCIESAWLNCEGEIYAYWCSYCGEWNSGNHFWGFHWSE